MIDDGWSAFLDLNEYMTRYMKAADRAALQFGLGLSIYMAFLGL